MEDSVIDHGPMGGAGYQAVTNRMLPLRGLDPRFDLWNVRLTLRAVEWLVPRLRAWARKRAFGLAKKLQAVANRRWSQPASSAHGQGLVAVSCHEFAIAGADGTTREEFLRLLLADGWQSGGDIDAWDVSKDGTRILLACELGDDGGKQILVRVWGDSTAMDTFLQGRGWLQQPFDL